MNKWTGEIHELPDDTAEQISEAWQALSETIKGCERAKDKLKPKVEALSEDGKLEVGDHQFRIMAIQRMNYDKATMRQLIADEDLLDDLLVPNKPLLDDLLKKQDPRLWPISSELRDSMIAEGNPYQVIRLEKI